MKRRRSPIVFLLVGLLFLLVAVIVFYFVWRSADRRLGRLEEAFDLKLVSSSGKPLSGKAWRFYLDEVEQMAHSYRGRKRGRFVADLRGFDFVASVYHQRRILRKDLLRLNVHEPVAVLWPNQGGEPFLLSAKGKLLRYRAQDLPILSVRLASGRGKSSLQSSRVRRWLSFLYEIKMQKDLLIFPHMSELIIEDKLSKFRWRSINTVALLPQIPGPKLGRKLDALYRYLRKKGKNPVKVDLRGESAIVKP